MSEAPGAAAVPPSTDEEAQRFVGVALTLQHDRYGDAELAVCIGTGASYSEDLISLAEMAAAGPVPIGFDPWAPLAAAEAMALSDSSRAAFEQWAVAAWLQQERAEIERDGQALLSAIGAAAGRRLALSDWLAVAYMRKLSLIDRFEAASLVEVFGPLRIVGPNRVFAARQRLRQLRELDKLIYHAAREGKPMDKLLHVEIGNALGGVGQKKAEELMQERKALGGMGYVALKKALRQRPLTRKKPRFR